MKWVKCINPLAAGLTYNKIYKVRNYHDWNGLKYIELIDDDGRITTYDMFPSHPNAKIWFEDATADIREEKLKEIGI